MNHRSPFLIVIAAKRHFPNTSRKARKERKGGALEK